MGVGINDGHSGTHCTPVAAGAYNLRDPGVSADDVLAEIEKHWSEKRNPGTKD